MNHPFNEMLQTFIDNQQKMVSSLMSDFKTPMEVSKNYDELIKNSIKFHRAAIAYHNAVIEMMELTENSIRLMSIKK